MLIGFVAAYVFMHTEYFISSLFVAFLGIIATLIGMAMLMGGEKKE